MAMNSDGPSNDFRQKEENDNEFRWAIENIWEKMRAHCFFESSPIFSFKDTSENKWELRVFEHRFQCYEQLLVTLRLVEGKPVTIKQSISILDCKGRTTHRQEEMRKHSAEVHSCVSVNRIKPISWDMLVRRHRELMPNRTLTLCCKIEAVAYSSPGSSTYAESQSTEAFGFGCLLANPLFSDITLVAEGREFHVHRALLASSSSVFAGLFQRTDQKRLEMTDMRADVLQDMLRFIYTGSVDNVSLLEELFVAAKKYRLEQLEKICGIQLIATLTVDNVVDRLVMNTAHTADYYFSCAYYIRECAIAFIVKNAAQVAESPSWSKMLQYPELISEAFRALVVANRKDNTTPVVFQFGKTNQE